MFTQTIGENGLRLLTASSPATDSMTLLILVGAGSRYETSEERGLAHFQEHMFFKGGDRYPNAKSVAQAIDGVGGDFNAFTGKEYVGYYVKVSADKKEFAFDVLSDMLLNAQFHQEEIEKERGVILEEMNMYEDMPIYKIGWDFEELMFGDHPMALDQIGTKELILGVQQKDFQDYKEKLYTSENTVIIASGNILEEESVLLTQKYFSFPSRKKSREKIPFSWENTVTGRKGKVCIRNKKTEQAQLVIGYPGLDRFDPEKYAESILAVIMGGNMSSRMFSNVREEKGLCYSISSSTDRYTDCGLFSTRAGVSITGIEDAITAICYEYDAISKKPPLKEEVQRAKNYLKGKVTLRMEDSEEVANFLGIQLLLQNEVSSLDEYFDKIEAVTPEEVFSVAQRIFDPQKRSMAIIGPYDSDQQEHLKTVLEKC